MFLSIDAGNSNIVFGLFDPKELLWKHEFRVETRFNLLEHELEGAMHLYFLENNLHKSQISQVGISSVVPEINALLVQFCQMYLRLSPYLISGESYRNLQISTSKPNEIGSDLMANAVAAYTKFQCACIIVDFGTALTFTVIDIKGEMKGVNIVPGIKTAIKSLHTNTSKLPEVSLDWPASAIGKDTVHSIQAGILYGYAGLVKGMIESIKEELPNENFKIVATGGLSSILVNLKERFDELDRNLTLEGIRQITLHNRSGKSFQ
ncbi:type III pantothenate kinase [Anditalea andensis]|uniref:Type III pantothenate kinase n=1 Tax=Anditalea andensis TaxID=1048983 RepID=A0A074LI68_9BACT|nr:type III pantothenate kinase [Anditalea andensis]KEO73482.1 transcriptional regulator [Anditalea andensis]